MEENRTYSSDEVSKIVRSVYRLATGIERERQGGFSWSIHEVIDDYRETVPEDLRSKAVSNAELRRFEEKELPKSTDVFLKVLAHKLYNPK